MVLFVGVSIVTIVAVVVVGKFLALPDTPESGFAGMMIMFGVMLLGPILLIPALIGIVLALISKRAAEAQLRDMREQDPMK